MFINLKYRKLVGLTFNSKNTFSYLNVSVFDLQASYFRGKCIDECATELPKKEL